VLDVVTAAFQLGDDGIGQGRLFVGPEGDPHVRQR
jgi:hypothetical protein